jgi:small subunit ribosomal protein S15
MITKDKKEKIIKKFEIHPNDSGSPEVQVAIFTERIKELTQHLKEHKKDNHSRRGLLKLVAKRKKLLDYLKETDKKRFNKITKDLTLKG